MTDLTITQCTYVTVSCINYIEQYSFSLLHNIIYSPSILPFLFSMTSLTRLIMGHIRPEKDEDEVLIVPPPMLSKLANLKLSCLGLLECDWLKPEDFDGLHRMLMFYFPLSFV